MNIECLYFVFFYLRFIIYVDNILSVVEVLILIESNQPVVAERAVYFNGGLAGHDTVGANFPSQEWYLAEGMLCMFYFIIDVEYNDVWFYLFFWLDFLGKLL